MGAIPHFFICRDSGSVQHGAPVDPGVKVKFSAKLLVRAGPVSAMGLKPPGH